MGDIHLFDDLPRLCHGMWLFHLHSTVKRQPFPPVFPLAESDSQGIFPVIPLELQGKKHQSFSITQPFYWLLPWNFEKAPAIS